WESICPGWHQRLQSRAVPPQHSRSRGRAMGSDGSVSRLIDGLVIGDPAAVEKLWERYFRRLVGLARKKLADAPRRAADEEDVALSAFNSFCQNAEQGRLPQLLDRDSLWRVLVVITVRKAAHLRRDEGRQKRGGGMAHQTETTGADDSSPMLEAILSQEPSPEFAALA